MKESLVPQGVNLEVVNARIDKDTFFDENADGVIRVFDFDYEAVVEYSTALQQNNFYFCYLNPYTIPAIPLLCYLQQYLLPLNVRDVVYARHVCLTRDGIKYVVDHHLANFRCECQRVGRVSKTIPYDKITDCDVEEPAGSSGPCCCLVKNVLHVVNVDTASSGATERGFKHELRLVGLVDPHAFKRAVWAMKRGEVNLARNGGGEGKSFDRINVKQKQKKNTSSTAYSSTGNAKDEETVPLLKEQNKLLKNIHSALQENNKLLKRSISVNSDK